MKRRIIQIHPSDNVAVAIEELRKGESLSIGNQTVVLKQDIPAGHKVALLHLNRGENIIKYGAPIGHAVADILPGEWVNEKNIRTNLDGLEEYSYNPQPLPAPTAKKELFFKGYRRKSGGVGIRNEMWIIPTVGCVNGIVSRLEQQFRQRCNCKGIDAVVAFPHNYGCSQLGDDHENTRKILRNMALHPNAGGVLIVGLGCENNQIDAFRELLGDYDSQRIRFMETQKVEDELETGLNLLWELYEIASEDIRTDIPFDELRVGLKCGGSDGFSGITANPLLGAFSDFLISQGGTTVLTEVPEMFGAEKLLMDRSESVVVFNQTVRLINDFKSYFTDNKQPIYENPSPGNKVGGISTLEEKSLGCTQKAGSSAVKDVLSYGERLRTNGLNLLSAPGNDLVASTALAASGCHLVLFTTGRGTPFGTFVPTVKIATNSDLYQRKPGWIDFNAGTLLDGDAMETLLERFICYIIRIAEGEFANNEKNAYREMAIFKTGVTL